MIHASGHFVDVEKQAVVANSVARQVVHIVDSTMTSYLAIVKHRAAYTFLQMEVAVGDDAMTYDTHQHTASEIVVANAGNLKRISNQH